MLHGQMAQWSSSCKLRICGDFLSHNIILLQHDKILHKCESPLRSIVNCLYGLQHLRRKLDPSNLLAKKPMFRKYVRNWLNKDCLGHFLKDCQSQLCHAEAKKLCGSGNNLICANFQVCSELTFCRF